WPVGPHAAETDVGTAVVRCEAVSGRTAAALPRLGPRAATDHALATILSGPGAAVRRRPLVGSVPGVLTPFPDVAVHVVETPGIRSFLADGRVVALGVARKPGVVAEQRRVVAERIRRGRAGPAGVFPLGLGRQPD